MKGMVFDLDGTLVDSVYQHAFAWHEALRQINIDLSVWRIHRKIGMSGGLLTEALLRETGIDVDETMLWRMQEFHAAAYERFADNVVPLPGAVAMLEHLTELKVPWAVATSSLPESATRSLIELGVPPSVPVVTRDQVQNAKPDPDLFLEAMQRLGLEPDEVVIVGDSVWDLLAARRARSLGVGLLSGGYGTEELEKAGAYRVYEDPQDLFNHLDEVGIRRRPLGRKSNNGTAKRAVKAARR